jgi:hypothetical protein
LRTSLAAEAAARIAAEEQCAQASAQAAGLHRELAQLEVDQRKEVLTLRQVRMSP